MTVQDLRSSEPNPGDRVRFAPDASALHPLARGFYVAATATLVMLALSYGQALLMPLACAALLAFVLDPLVTRLRRWGLPLVVAVTMVVLLTLASAGAAGVLVARQITTLAQDLPSYQNTIREKLRALRLAQGSGGALQGASQVLAVVEGEIDAARTAFGAQSKAPSAKVTRVQLEPVPPSPFSALAAMLTPLLTPLATTGFVIVLLAYLLAQRRALTDRMVLLVGGDLHRMANVLNDAARRVSRYLAIQLLVNLGFGLCFAIGLWVIGVPAAFLWGALAALLRFVPYVGTLVAAALPLLLAFAVQPGWDMVLWTAVLLVGIELVVINVVEPIAYSGSTGISAAAVLISAAFWVLIWGPMGLILATPLTVCLLVLGRHLGALKFLDVLLGDEPAFEPPTLLYRRLIAGDHEEAIEISAEAAERSSALAFYSDVGIPMLALAAASAQQGATAEQRWRVQRGVKWILEDLLERHPVQAAGPATVLCIGARDEIDTLSAEMLAHALLLGGLQAQAVPAVSISADRIAELQLQGVQAVILCGFQAAPSTHARFVCKRLRRRNPGLHITLAAWSATGEALDIATVKTAGANALATRPVEVAAQLNELPAWPGAESSSGSEAPAAAPRDASAQDVMARGAQRAAEIFGVPLASVVLRVVLRDQPGPWLLESAGRATWTSDSRLAPDADGSPLAKVLQLNETLVIGDTARVPEFAAGLGGRYEGLVAFAGVPLRDKAGAVRGALALHDASARSFSSEDLTMLEVLGRELCAEVDALAETAGVLAADSVGLDALGKGATGKDAPASSLVPHLVG